MSFYPRKPGAQPGNKNALKASGRAETFLMCRVRPEDKRLWKAAARLDGLTLSQWVIRELNRITENKNT